MSQSSKDLFIFGAHGRKTVRELVTPHKVSLLALIYEYCQTKKSVPLVLMGQTHGGETTPQEEREKKDFMITILHLLQVCD